MRHRAVFWHLISRRTQGSISQTRPPGSHFIISAVPIRTLTAAAQRLLPSFLFIYLSIFLPLPNCNAFCLKAPWNWSCCQPESSRSCAQAATNTQNTHTHKNKKLNNIVFWFFFAISLSPMQTHQPIYKDKMFFCTFVISCQSRPGNSSGISAAFTCVHVKQHRTSPHSLMGFDKTQMVFIPLWYFICSSPWKIRTMSKTFERLKHLNEFMAFLEMNTVRLEISLAISGFVIILQVEIGGAQLVILYSFFTI